MPSGKRSGAAQDWRTAQRHPLKQTGPEPVLAEVRRWRALHAEPSDWATAVAYLEKRTAHMPYPALPSAGWPMGDGAVESANKLGGAARLKGRAMHWARPHVDAMLALRNIVCRNRWEEAGPQIAMTLRQQAQQRRTATRVEAAPPAPTTTHGITEPQCARTHPPAAAATPGEPWRPPAHHPWRHRPIGRARFRPPAQPTNAKP
jgi:hypothetical protein